MRRIRSRLIFLSTINTNEKNSDLLHRDMEGSSLSVKQTELRGFNNALSHNERSVTIPLLNEL